jgi:hypothetical protein
MDCELILVTGGTPVKELLLRSDLEVIGSQCRFVGDLIQFQ